MPVDLSAIRADLSNRVPDADLSPRTRALQLTHDAQSYTARVTVAEYVAAGFPAISPSLERDPTQEVLLVVSDAVMPQGATTSSTTGSFQGSSRPLEPLPDYNFELSVVTTAPVLRETGQVEMPADFEYTGTYRSLPDPCFRP